jgi:hypothetical protein
MNPLRCQSIPFKAGGAVGPSSPRNRRNRTTGTTHLRSDLKREIARQEND